jgi:hypothetical protein
LAAAAVAVLAGPQVLKGVMAATPLCLALFLPAGVVAVATNLTLPAALVVPAVAAVQAVAVRALLGKALAVVAVAETPVELVAEQVRRVLLQATAQQALIQT